MSARSRSAPPDAPAAPSEVVLLATKLHIPSLRDGHVPRPALLARLATGRGRRLVLVDAPPGWGKTTLLAEWRAHLGQDAPFAWVTLDGADNDPVRFWMYVIEAIRTVRPDVGAEAGALLRSSTASVADLVLPALINELAAVPEPLTIVLDDYHVVSSRPVQEQMELFVERLPAGVTLVVATRSDPSLPLSRLRARDELLEIRAAELRFSRDETAALLGGALALELSEQDVSRIHQRTEGWAAGLYLAALSLRAQPDAEEFLRALAGDDRHVVDYLGAEVLDRQPPEVLSFLIRTSVLDQMCGPLCDEVLERTGSAELLEQIERSNLFVVPLDNRRRWYRYHRLFGELLRHELDLREPSLAPELHRRAAAWHRSEGAVAEAIHHSLRAGSVDETAELVGAAWIDYFNEGRLATVTVWLDALPEDLVDGDPGLCLARAWIAMDTGRLEEAGRWLDAATSARARATAPSTEAAIAVARVVHGFKTGDLTTAARSAHTALDLVETATPFDRTVAHLLAGVIDYWLGHPEQAVAALEEGVAQARQADNKLGAVYGLGYLALVHAEGGRVDEAVALADEVAELTSEPARAEHFVAMMVELARAVASEARGATLDAEAASAQAVKLSRRGAGRLEQARALSALASARRALGDSQDAAGLRREARRLLALCADPGSLAAPAARAAAPRAAARADDGGRPAAPEELTDRELSVLRLLPSELSQREIGRTLYVSLNTVKTHTRNIFRKLGAESRAEAVERARRHGLL